MRAQGTIDYVLRTVVIASSLATANPNVCWTTGQSVKTTSGLVEGHAARSTSQVSEYFGIPYAKAPVGNLRFQPPVKFWGSSTINGSDYGHQCMQPIGKGTSPDAYDKLGVPASAAAVFTALQVTGSQSEDCLTLDVWTKPQTGDFQKAVSVWIHGGGFTTGNFRVPGYNGKFVVDQTDVIVISLNYHLNVFGFPGNPVSASNLGLLDVRLAMEWIRDNIANSGGDVSRVTLFGESAGGSLVDYYSYAYASDPIAKGFILMSGGLSRT
ncbi:carboxylesterase [Colletotrichum tofieldiae]|uniref:Carboxylesterase n=1 Tax=Colletotrichum tofieldiae TaxID=708197 RepID=A0A161VP87_9PEZI|nr:carboxylesterase [Colletotrichum tofieldiae]